MLKCLHAGRKYRPILQTDLARAMLNSSYRIPYSIWCLVVFLFTSSGFASIEKFEESLESLNITDQEQVRLFVKEWSRPSLYTETGFPNLAVQAFPTWKLGLHRRQQDRWIDCFGQPLGCSGAAQCCGTAEDLWCCLDTRTAQCCGGRSPGCCPTDKKCCGGSEAGGEGACCDKDQGCDEDTGTCTDPM